MIDYKVKYVFLKNLYNDLKKNKYKFIGGSSNTNITSVQTLQVMFQNSINTISSTLNNIYIQSEIEFINLLNNLKNNIDTFRDAFKDIFNNFPSNISIYSQTIYQNLQTNFINMLDTLQSIINNLTSNPFVYLQTIFLDFKNNFTNVLDNFQNKLNSIISTSPP